MAGEEAPKSDLIIRDIDTAETTVADVRKEVQPQAAGASVPIDRIPLRPQLVQMANAGIPTMKVGGTDRCIRIIAVPVRGGGAVQCHCSKACVSIGDQKLCPEHDKEAFLPNQTAHGSKQRFINSASVPLSKGELADCGLKEDPTLRDKVDALVAKGAAIMSPPEGIAPQALPDAKGLMRAAGQVQVSFSLDELSSKQLLNIVAERIVEALDSLPCGNLRQMKQMAAIQEKVARIARKARRTKGDVTNAAE